MNLIDTHCHIYVEEFKGDLEEIVHNAENEGVVKMLMPAIDSVTHEDMLDVERRFGNQCRSMMGLHPCSVKENYKDELRIVHEFLQNGDFVAVGEIGLDFYWDTTFKEQQMEAFGRQIEWALEHDLPIVIHSRNSIDECIEMVANHQNGKLKGVFHCFSGNLDHANKIIDLGFYLGIGGVLTYKNSGLDVVIEKTGIERVVLETDAPYLSPVPFRGKRNQPAYIRHVAERLSLITNRKISEVAEITTENAQNLFGL